MNTPHTPAAPDKAQPAVDWDAVYRELLPGVYNFFRYRVSDDALAEDLTATTFLKAWRGRAGYRHDLSAFSTWVYAIARRVAIDHLRSARHTQPLSLLEDAAAAEHTEAQAQQRADFVRLSDLLAELPSDDRELIALKYGAGITNRTIAGLLGMSESNVGTRLYRIVQRLRADWEPES
jgi:RNA polymerase sigma-70 factor (ECF subfamily)